MKQRKIKKISSLFLTLSILTILLFGGARKATAVSGQINITAYITGKNGQSISNGEYDVRFAIYNKDRKEIDAYPSNSDAKIWEETQKVYIFEGSLSAYLGSSNAFPQGLSFSEGDYYLGVRISNDSEMIPRKKIGAVPNAINSSFLDGHAVGDKEGDVLLLGKNGKIDTSFLQTGNSSNQLVLGNDSRFKNINNIHLQNSDTGTVNPNFNLGSDDALGNNFNISVSSASAKPTLRFNGLLGKWQYSNDGTLFVDLAAGSSGTSGNYLDLAGGTMTGAIMFDSAQTFGGATQTELNYLAGVTSNIQAQLDSKLSSASALYGATGNLLSLAGNTFSVKAGTLTNGKLCTYDTVLGMVCTTDSASVGHSPLTIGATPNGLTVNGSQQVSLALASTSTTGALSMADWNTFNSKQNALNGTGLVRMTGSTVSYDNTTYVSGTPWTSMGYITSAGTAANITGLTATVANLNTVTAPLGSAAFTDASAYVTGTPWTSMGYITVDTNTTYSAGGSLLSLAGTTFSMREGTLTNGKLCTYDTVLGMVCTTDSASVGHSPLTIGATPNGLTVNGSQQVSLALASTSTTGALSMADWNTFNSKQNALNGTGLVRMTGSTVSYDNTAYVSGTPWTLMGYITSAGTAANLAGLTATIANINTITNPLGTAAFTAASNYATSAHNHTGVYAPALIANQNYVNDAQLTTLTNTSGTNTGDNATNSQYSGLATSKQNALSGTGFVKISGTTISYDNTTYVSGTPWTSMGYVSSTGTLTNGKLCTYDTVLGMVCTTDSASVGHSPLTLAGTVDYLTLVGQQISLNQIDLATDITGTLPIAKGGTGQTGIPTSGQLLIGNGSGFVLSALAPSTGISIINSLGSITIANTGVVGLVGTANQVDVSASTGNVTLSLPQSIATTSSPTFLGMTLSNALSVGNGGTGTATQFTQGSLVFAGVGGVYSQDNANLFWDNTNKGLGIGMSTPGTYKLNVNGSAHFSGSILSDSYIFAGAVDPGGINDGLFLMNKGNTNGTGSSLNFYFNNSAYTIKKMASVISAMSDNTVGAEKGYLAFDTMKSGTLTEQMRILDNGNVGIGTISPEEKLHVMGNQILQGSSLVVGSKISGLSFRGYTGYATPNEAAIDSYVPAGSPGVDLSDLRFYTSNGSTDRRGEKMRITPEGNVGIGTTNPSIARMEISRNSTSLYNLLLSGASDGITNFAVQGASTNMLWTSRANYFDIQTNTAGKGLNLQTNGGNLMVDGNGNAGIGTTTPGVKLQVQSSSATDAAGWIGTSALNAVGNTASLYLSPQQGFSTSNLAIVPRIYAYGQTKNGGEAELRFDTYSGGRNTAMTIDGLGNVGIGITNPGAKLQVDGNVVISNLGPITGAIKLLVNGFQVNDLGAITASTEIKTSGQIISTLATGTAPLAVSSTTLNTNLNSDMLDGLHASSFATGSGTTGQVAYWNAGALTSEQYLNVSRGGTGTGALTQGSMIFAGASGVYSQDNANLYWDNTNKRLGLGTTTPNAMLSIFGVNNSLRLSYDAANYGTISSTNNGDIQFVSSTTSESAIFVGNNAATNDSIVFDNASQDYYAAIDNADGVFKIGAGQSVGTTPLLSAKASTFNVGVGTVSPLSTTRFNIAGIGSTSATYGIIVRESTNAIDNFYIKDDGSGYLRAAAWTFGSDARMKENINYLGEGLDKIMKLKPASFDYISGAKSNLGFIAQDVQSVIPQAVVVSNSETGMLGLKTEFIVPYLVKAVQEQQAMINDQKTNMGLLETSVADILTTQQSIQSQMDLIGQLNKATSDFIFSLDVKDLVYKNSLGNIDLSGGKLVANEVETGILTISIIDRNNPSIGQSSITKVVDDVNSDGIDDKTSSNGKEVEIKTNIITEESKIFTSFANNPGSSSWVEKVKDPDTDAYTGFKVFVEQAVKSDVDIDWWVVQSKK